MGDTVSTISASTAQLSQMASQRLLLLFRKDADSARPTLTAWLGGRSGKNIVVVKCALARLAVTCSTSGAPKVCGLSLHSTTAALCKVASTSVVEDWKSSIICKALPQVCREVFCCCDMYSL